VTEKEKFDLKLNNVAALLHKFVGRPSKLCFLGFFISSVRVASIFAVVASVNIAAIC